MKRFLSILLTMTMVFTLLIGNTSVLADADLDFADAADITYTEAVEIMSAIGAVDGMKQSDGTFTFEPNGMFTRSQAAKLLAYMELGEASAEALPASSGFFGDVPESHWASKYIGYCENQKIVHGYGNGLFGPDDNVTGYEYGKMLLVALGYKADIAGLTGDEWKNNTGRIIYESGLSKGLENPDKDLNNQLTREEAILFSFNAINSPMVEYKPLTENETEGTLNIEIVSAVPTGTTIGMTVFGLIKVKGMIVGNEQAKISTLKDLSLKEGETAILEVSEYGEEIKVLNFSSTIDDIGTVVTAYINDAGKKTENVFSHYKDENSTYKFAEEADSIKDLIDNAVLSEDVRFFVNFEEMPQSKAINMINNAAVSKNNGKFALNGIETILTDYDDNGAVDYVFYILPELTRINKIDKIRDTITFTQLIRNDLGVSTGNTKTVTAKMENVVTAIDPAVNDLVLVKNIGDKFYISICNTEIGNAVITETQTANLITLDGTVLEKSGVPNTLTINYTGISTFNHDKAAKELKDEDATTFYKDEYGYIIAYTLDEDTLSPKRTITSSGSSTGSSYTPSPTPPSPPPVTVVYDMGLVIGSSVTLSEPPVSTVKILKDNGVTGTYEVNTTESAAPFNYNPLDLTAYLTSGAANGTAIEYVVNSDNTLTIKNVLNHNTHAQSDGPPPITVPDDASQEFVYIAENAAAQTAGIIENGTESNMQYELREGYTAGAATISAHPGGADFSNIFNIDSNTVAFFYDVVDSADILTDGKYFGTTFLAGDVVYTAKKGIGNIPAVSADTRAHVFVDGNNVKAVMVGTYPENTFAETTEAPVFASNNVKQAYDDAPVDFIIENNANFKDAPATFTIYTDTLGTIASEYSPSYDPALAILTITPPDSLATPVTLYVKADGASHTYSDAITITPFIPASGLTVTTAALGTPEEGRVTLTITEDVPSGSGTVYYKVVGYPETAPGAAEFNEQYLPEEWQGTAYDAGNPPILEGIADGSFVEAVLVVDNAITKWGVSAATDDEVSIP